ncbi:hypothetical protein [Pseudonocardia sp. EC080619-01]|uniref:hypothetical protein n=1 Tax=Pseudonocardia sp. EC080619-01 TaxID=1096856 RepID=UPI0011AE72CF|nr:hypothetical protein [Pseudonocardia sp. EC080619-01]
MEYAGAGRRPKYCYQVVGGVMHDRVNAKRIADGGTPARRRGEPDDALARPIARAGQTVTDQVAALIARLEEGGTELRDALGTLADPEAVAAEIAAAQRAARAEIDAAQAATDQARAEARAARDAAETERDHAVATRASLDTELAHARADLAQRDTELAAARAEAEQVSAELVAMRADLDAVTAERDTALAARDTAVTATTQVTGELAALTRDHSRTETELASARQRAEQLATERDTIAANLTAELAVARRDLDRTETDRARLADELHEAREQAAESRAARAGAESSLSALREQLLHDVDRERAYGEQRLTDAETRHTAQLADLRTELARARRRTTGRSAEKDLDPTDTDPDNIGNGVDAEPTIEPSRPPGARRARPRAAQRRPGPTATDSTAQPGDTAPQE